MPPQSLEMLFSEHAPVMRSYAMSLTRDYDEAQDLFQEAALRACRSFERFQQGSSFRAWIITLTRNAFLDMCRKRSLNQRLANTVGQRQSRSQMHFSADSPDKSLQAKELERIISDLDRSLGRPFQMVVDGYDYHEIAEDMSLPLGTVKSRIHFARKKLKQKVY